MEPVESLWAPDSLLSVFCAVSCKVPLAYLRPEGLVRAVRPFTSRSALQMTLESADREGGGLERRMRMVDVVLVVDGR